MAKLKGNKHFELLVKLLAKRRKLDQQIDPLLHKIHERKKSKKKAKP